MQASARVILIIATLAALVSAGACASGGDGSSGESGDRDERATSRQEQPERNPDIAGTSECIKADCGNKLYLDIEDDTRVFAEDGEAVDGNPVTKLRRGQRVSAWHVPGVAESYPGYTTATHIVIRKSDVRGAGSRRTDGGERRDPDRGSGRNASRGDGARMMDRREATS